MSKAEFRSVATRAIQDIGGAFGTKIGERGHFEASVQHREYDGILDRAYDRSWDNLAAIEGAGTAANPYALLDSNVQAQHLQLRRLNSAEQDDRGRWPACRA